MCRPFLNPLRLFCQRYYFVPEGACKRITMAGSWCGILKIVFSRVCILNLSRRGCHTWLHIRELYNILPRAIRYWRALNRYTVFFLCNIRSFQIFKIFAFWNIVVFSLASVKICKRGKTTDHQSWQKVTTCRPIWHLCKVRLILYTNFDTFHVCHLLDHNIFESWVFSAVSRSLPLFCGDCFLECNSILW